MLSGEEHVEMNQWEAAPTVAFRLTEPLTHDRLSLDPVRRTRDVAAWVRHALGDVSEGWPFGDTSTVIHGHAEDRAAPRRRVSVIPLPSVTPQGVGGVGRVLLTGPVSLRSEIEWLGQRLAGRALVWRSSTVAVLEALATDDWVLGRYTGSGQTWSTVTPVVLPGHDDRTQRRAERLLLKSFAQAGWSPDDIANIRALEWSKVGFRDGLAHASDYVPPDKVEGPMFHVRLALSRPRTGPIAVGSGRHRGLGTFARDDEAPSPMGT